MTGTHLKSKIGNSNSFYSLHIAQHNKNYFNFRKLAEAQNFQIKYLRLSPKKINITHFNYVLELRIQTIKIVFNKQLNSYKNIEQ